MDGARSPTPGAAIDDERRASAAGVPRLWVERLQLTNFRNYAASLQVGPAPVVLYGANGAGKTNLLEALSLLTSGQGLRRAPYSELACGRRRQSWAVWSRVHGRLGTVELGTGLPRRAG